MPSLMMPAMAAASWIAVTEMDWPKAARSRVASSMVAGGMMPTDSPGNSIPVG